MRFLKGRPSWYGEPPRSNPCLPKPRAAQCQWQAALRFRRDARPGTWSWLPNASPIANTEPSRLTGSSLSVLLRWVARRPERQSRGGSPGGDKSGVMAVAQLPNPRARFGRTCSCASAAGRPNRSAPCRQLDRDLGEIGLSKAFLRGGASCEHADYWAGPPRRLHATAREGSLSAHPAAQLVGLESMNERARVVPGRAVPAPPSALAPPDRLEQRARAGAARRLHRTGSRDPGRSRRRRDR